MLAFLDRLPSHVWLDGGRLTVVHVGLQEEMIGRGSDAVWQFALEGKPDWAASYRGATAIVHGHTPVCGAWHG